MDRSEYYDRKFSVEQVTALENLSEQDFAAWVNAGATVRGANQVVENARATAHRGQVVPGSRLGGERRRRAASSDVTTAEDFSAIDNMSADEYQKLLESSKDGIIHGSPVNRSEYDLIPNRAATEEEMQQIIQDQKMFFERYPALIADPDNGVQLLTFLKKHHAIGNLRNLEKAYAGLFADLHFMVVEEDRSAVVKDKQSGDYRDKINIQSKTKAIYVPTQQAQQAKRKLKMKTVRGGDLSATEQARLMQPHASREVSRVDGMTADAFYKEFLDNENDHLPDVIVKRIERAIGEFRNACPDYDPSDPENREIVELYLNEYNLDRGSAQSYVQAWEFYKRKNVVPIAPTDEVVIGGRKLGKTIPEIHGTDPTFNLNPQLRRPLRAMSSQELYEYFSQHPEVRAEVDKNGL